MGGGLKWLWMKPADSSEILLRLLRTAMGEGGGIGCAGGVPSVENSPVGNAPAGNASGENMLEENSPVGGAAVNWPEVMEIARCQGVSTVALDALESLTSGEGFLRNPAGSDSGRVSRAHDMPPAALLMRCIGRTAATERAYAEHRESLAALAGFYGRHGIRMLLLKGYGCSLCYPVPEHRPPGDADIYLFGRKEEADALAERELGVRIRRSYHKHSTFSFRGVEVENHAKFIDDMSHRSNVRFERVLMRALDGYPCVASPLDNVLLPPPTFNALFLLRHTGEHFASDGISLRHILDVGTFFRRHHSEIDWDFVFPVYGRERMLAFFNGVATVCVNRLGFPPECFASDDGRFSYSEDTALAESILGDVFAEKERLPMSTAGIRTAGQKLRYAAGKTRRWWRNRWKYRLVYDENLAESLLWLARNRLKSF